MSYRLRFLSFYADVISIFPLHMLTYMLNQNMGVARLYTMLHLNKLLRVWRIISFFREQEDKLYRNLFAIKMIKIVSYLIIIAVWAASILYMVACYYEVCYSISWYYVRNFVNSLSKYSSKLSIDKIERIR